MGIGCYVFGGLNNNIYHIGGGNATLLLTGNPPNLARIFGNIKARDRAKKSLESIEGVRLILAKSGP